MNVIFAGTPEIAATILEHLTASGVVEINAVLTQPDRLQGRGKKLAESPVKVIAKKNNISILQPQSFKKNPQIIDTIKVLKPDLMIVVAYGLILPEHVLNIPKYGCINIHVSLLPKWRGAAPIQRAIEAGDKTTGISIIQMDKGLDSGDILNTVSCDIAYNETSASLHHKLANLAVPLLVKTIKEIQTGSVKSIKQDHKNATYAEKIKKSDGQINWQQAAEKIERKIRAFYPWPCAFTHIEGQPVKLLKASVIEKKHQLKPGSVIAVSKDSIQITTGKDILTVSELQFPGKKPMHIKEIINGKPLDHLIGTVIGGQS